MAKTPAYSFTIHPRTLDELRTEFISDIRRRILYLDREMSGKNLAASRSRELAKARAELEFLAEYWEVVQIKRKPRDRRVPNSLTSGLGALGSGLGKPEV